MHRWSVALTIMAWGIVGLAGCAASPPKPTRTLATLVASPSINPDALGQPSPVVVRLYQLRGKSRFMNAGFFALYDHQRRTLGSSLITRDERTVFPGQDLPLHIDLSAGARYLGVLAAYRNVRTTRWRAVVGVPKKSLLKLLASRRVTVHVGKSAVNIAVSQ